MIKLDPEDEPDEDDQPLSKTPQKLQMPPPNTSQAMANDVTMNHQHMNNVQINLNRVTIPTIAPQQNFVSFKNVNFQKPLYLLSRSIGKSNQR